MKRIAVFGGSFNPPGIHHQMIVAELSRLFDEVKVIPCGPRSDKKSIEHSAPIHRAAMADLTFSGLWPNVEVDLFDLEEERFTPHRRLLERYTDEVWFVVGSDLIQGGKHGLSEIQRTWVDGSRLWNESRFAVIARDGFPYLPEDLPPRAMVLNPGHIGSSAEIRTLRFQYKSVHGLIVPEVFAYMNRYRLYQGGHDPKSARFRTEAPRLLLSADTRNPEAMRLMSSLRAFEDHDHANMIVSIGGDGTMLHTIQKYWRRRLPFLGINKGHVGFLLNNIDSAIEKEFFQQEFVLRPSPLLYIEATSRDGAQLSRFAFNDASSHAPLGHVGRFEISINSTVYLEELRSDGVLVATPAGSTAWARAMGARPVPLGTDVLILVGSNVIHPFEWRSGANIPSSSRIVIRNTDSSGKRTIKGLVDGIQIASIREMHVRMSKIAAAELLFAPGYDIEQKLVASQFPPRAA